MRLLLDSTFVIDLLDGVPEAIDRQHAIFETGDEPFVNEVVVCEVRAGMRHADQPSLVGILEPIEFVQQGPASAMLAGEWRRSAHERGYKLSLPDALIASTADAMGAAVLTRNVRDFTLTPVRIETY
ncbi:MAG: type II toxin-antitoxin system VapC family toxin [Chloroflexota bacterium]